jgi:uncharacterized protein
MTPGSVYNVEALRNGELEFALIQSDVAYDAYHGKGAYSEAPFPALRSVLALHSELVTIVARAGIHDLSDLACKRIVAGPAGSGSRATWEAMVKALGWKDGQTPRTLDMPVDAIGNALCKGSIDASLLVLGHPSGKIRDLLAGCALNLVPVEGPAIDSLVAGAPYLKKGPIPANAYGLPADVPSFGLSAILMTTAAMDARAVSDFASSLGTEIQALKQKSPVLENLSAQDIVTKALPAPLHPAALEAYKKLGLLKTSGLRASRRASTEPSIHHRRLENAHHRRVRGLFAQVADPMRHIATVPQRLAAAGGSNRLADLDLELAVQNRQALDRAAQMGGRFENSAWIGLKIVPLEPVDGFQPANDREAAQSVVGDEDRCGPPPQMLDERALFSPPQHRFDRHVERVGQTPDRRQRRIGLIALDLRDDRLGDARML